MPRVADFSTPACGLVIAKARTVRVIGIAPSLRAAGGCDGYFRMGGCRFLTVFAMDFRGKHRMNATLAPR